MSHQTNRRKFLVDSARMAGVLGASSLLTPTVSSAWVGTRMRKGRVFAGPALQILTAMGLTDSLKLCLDAGDSSSYSSGQTWTDRSGNSTNFYRGTTSGSESSDPPFNGTPGNLSASEYFSFDGADYFTLTSANPSWVNTLHQSGAKFTILVWAYMVTGSGNGLIGTRSGHNQTGIYLGRGATNSIVQISNSSGTQALSSGGGACPIDTWALYSVSLDEAVGSGGGFLGINDSFSTFNSTITSPDSGPATQTMQIGARGGDGSPLQSGSRLAMALVWQGITLSQSQVGAFYSYTRGRFGV